MKSKHFLWFVAIIIGINSVAFAQKVTLEPYEPGEGVMLTSKGNSWRLSGFMQPMIETRAYSDTAENNTFTRYRMRRMVTRLTGRNSQYNISYQVQVDLTGSSEGGGDATTNNYLMDAWVAWRPIRQLNIKFGQDGSNSDTREMMMRSNALQLVDRSPVSLAFSSIREYGLWLESKVRTGNYSFLATSFSVTNGDGANVYNNDFGGLKYSGRADFIPFGNFNNGGQFRQADLEYEMTPKLVIGAYYSYNQGITDRRGRASGTILYTDTAGNYALPDYEKYGADLLFKYKGFSLIAEYVNGKAIVPNNITYRVRNDGSFTNDFGLADSTQNKVAYIQNRIITGSGVNVQAGYMFRKGISVDGRYAVMMPEQYSFLRNATFNLRSRYYTLCLTKYFGRNYGSKVQASLTATELLPGAISTDRTPVKGLEFIGNIMFTIAL